MRATINGTELNMALAGDKTRPALFLVHSLASSHEMWGLQVPIFARHFQVIALDLRGHGASAAPASAYTLDQLADDVVGVANHLGIDRFHYCGLSIGGLVGQSLGLRYGNRLEKMVLSSTFTGPVNADGRKGWDDRIAAAAREGMGGQIEGTMGRWLSADFQKSAPRSSQMIRDIIATTPVAGFAGCAMAIRDMTLEPDQLKAIRTPTLVIAGERDPGATPAAGQRVADAIPGAAFHVVTGGYHLCNLEFPHHFSERILAFLLGGDHG